MEKTISKVKQCIILPGNGCSGNVRDANWYGQLEDLFNEKSGKYGQLFDKVILKTMPDPLEAKESIWIPFTEKQIGEESENTGPSNTVVIGHSSGAVCVLRLLEKLGENQKPYAGCVLVSACHTDLGEESEAISGYYNREWNWEKIKKASNWIIQFHGDNDPFIPLTESRHVAKELKLGDDYKEIKGGSHFFSYFEELPESILEKLQNNE